MDVTSTLSELERKLRELEDELQGSTTPPAAQADEPSPSAAWRAASPPPVPAPEPPAAPAHDAPASSAQAQLDDLLRFRGELERSAQQLMAEYERVIGSLRATTAEGPSAVAASSPPIAPGAPSVPSVPAPLPASHASIPQPPPLPVAAAPEVEPAPWQPAPAPGSLDDAVMDGAITVDAGPFTDITGLSGFEQALGGVPGVRDVYVRGFEGSRAMIDVTLGQPVALGTELRRFSPVAFSITAADAGRLSVAIQGA